MKTVAIVPVRMNSSRLPDKAMRVIAGKPLLGHLLDRLAEADSLDEVAVATSTLASNDVIEAYCASRHVPCFRGSEDDVLGRVTGALVWRKATTGVLAFGDGPIIDPSIVDLLSDVFHSGAFDLVGNDLSTTWPPGMEAEIICVDAMKDAERRCTDPVVREHSTLFIRQNPDRYRLKNVAAPAHFNRPDLSLEVDLPEDLVVMEALLANFAHQKDFGLADIIAWMNDNPEIAAVNRGLPRRWMQFR